MFFYAHVAPFVYVLCIFMPTGLMDLTGEFAALWCTPRGLGHQSCSRYSLLSVTDMHLRFNLDRSVTHMFFAWFCLFKYCTWPFWRSLVIFIPHFHLDACLQAHTRLVH